MGHIYFSHGIFFLYDSSERAPGNDWTDAHVAQRFARRGTAANVATLVEYGCFTVEVASVESLERCARVVVVSVRSDTGSISVSGTDSEGHVVWDGRPGWVRLTVGQLNLGEEGQIGLLVRAEEANADEPTRVFDDGEWLSGPFLESAEVAAYS